ncbi:Hypothetical predicted protein [Paramuricea clavata]|uniref:Uncharacterized protein n=1 Tax=Paramuricea clavata TaxID=317549 RepID=A0A6S7GUP9_PARCT|nr:Hypothetical predicted protein [Paramuricea clavata]
MQFLSYKSITDCQLRNLQLEIEASMKKLDMDVVGFTTDGEFNSLRTSGTKRPISIIEVIKNIAKGMKCKEITKYFTLDKEGNPLKSHPAVPPEDAKWCHDFMYDSDPPVTFHRACLILRRRLFPFHYDPYPWVKGRDETNVEVLKSLMAIYLHRAEVQNLRGLKEDPADFNSHLYQPELGGHTSGATVLKLLHNWHKAVDGRGLSEDQRSTYCEELKCWLLDDWVPWHREVKDYSQIDVNRPVKGICGLTREVIVGLVANLESRELRRIEYIQRNIKPEHPRSSSTDDVESFISLLHEILGLNFDLKQVFSELPKILNEFRKRTDKDLPFYY